MTHAAVTQVHPHPGESDAARLSGFPAISRMDARVLVLGSMPGVASLQVRQYYAHPRNAFWPIMGELLAFDATGAYPHRIAALLAQQVAVWDVLAACERRGSLDADIEHKSIVANDFADFFDRHRQIGRVYFNGAMAESLYRRHVAPRMGRQPSLEFLRLPSTSPAHAGMTLADKRVAWQAVHPNHRDGTQSAR